MRPQQPIKRFVSRATWTDNGRVLIDLPRDFDLNTLIIDFSGTATITTLFTAVRAEAPLQAIKFLSLKANGSDLLDGVPGVMAHRLGIFRRGQLPPLTAPASAAVGSQAFGGCLVLDRNVIDGIRPKDGAFPTRGLSSFQLELQMGACADLFTGAGVGTITGGTVTVSILQTQELGGPDGKITLPRVVTKRTHVDIPFPSSNTNFQHRLNTGNILRGMIFRATGAVTAGEPSNAILNNIKILRGNQVWCDLPALTVRELNACDYEVTTVPTGIYIVDFMATGGPAGKLSDCLDMRDGEEIWTFLDVTGGANVSLGITTLEYMPYSPKYWGIQV